jgi:hypothetical protein
MAAAMPKLVTRPSRVGRDLLVRIDETERPCFEMLLTEETQLVAPTLRWVPRNDTGRGCAVANCNSNTEERCCRAWM